MQTVIVSGVNVTALLTDASLEISVDEIDANALKDAWQMREYGRGDWRLSLTKLVSDSATNAIFPSMAVSRDPIGVTLVLATDSHTFSFTGMGIAAVGPVNVGDMISEECTFMSASTPVVTRT